MPPRRARLALLATFLAACTAHAPQEEPTPPPATGSGTAPAPAGLPAGHPPTQGSASALSDAVKRLTTEPASLATATADGALHIADILFDIPKDWRPTPPRSSMRAAQYAIPGDGGEGEVVFFFFGPGGGGPVADNVTRWLGQIVQSDGSPTKGETESRTQNGARLTLVRASGSYQVDASMGGTGEPRPDWSLLGVIVESPGGPVFVKILAPRLAMASAGPALDAFIASIRPAP